MAQQLDILKQSKEPLRYGLIAPYTWWLVTAVGIARRFDQ